MSKNNDAELRRAYEDVRIGETASRSRTITEKHVITKRRITRKTAVTNRRGQMVIDGKAVIAVMR